MALIVDIPNKVISRKSAFISPNISGLTLWQSTISLNRKDSKDKRLCSRMSSIPLNLKVVFVFILKLVISLIVKTSILCIVMLIVSLKVYLSFVPASLFWRCRFQWENIRKRFLFYEIVLIQSNKYSRITCKLFLLYLLDFLCSRLCRNAEIFKTNT